MLAEPPFSILENLNRVDDAIDANADIADIILETALINFGLPLDPERNDSTRNWHGTATQADVSKAHTTIRQLYRDWSVEGRREREVCYHPVLRDLKGEFDDNHSLEDVRVLVPGAGLARLVFDLCQEGFSVEGNEVSYHQLFASSWALNYTQGVQKHAVYPFALQFSNLINRNEQLTKVMVPDVHPASAMLAGEAGNNGHGFGNMSMTAADFMVLYTSNSYKEVFDAVATVFFIDTASNPIRYIETIHHCLKPGGIWTNVGPLLWHFGEGSEHHNHARHNEGGQLPGIGEPGNVEVTEEELILLLERMGFYIEKREQQKSCGYIQDPLSMMQHVYRPSHWVARKKVSI